ncbi:MAG: ParB/RepB/Spo0J family partition protein, partial [Bdellovibrionales bacterium]|nr:ParB/RepB/Spo0J family partition protein [Bdellovibrionales bacterium]
MVSNKRKKLENAAIFNPNMTTLKEDYKNMSAVEFLAYGGKRQPEEEKLATGSIHLIPLKETEVCPQSSGRPSEPTDIADLKQSIAENGLLQNIVVCLNAPGSKFKYRLIAGHRRRMACLSLGKTEIEAKILDVKPEDIASIEAVQLIENIQNKALTALEEARGILSLQEKSGLSVRDLSEKLGIKKTTLHD